MSIELLIYTHAIAAVVGGVLGVYATQLLHDLDVIANKETTMSATPKKPQANRWAPLKRLLAFPAWFRNLLMVIVLLAVGQGVYEANHTESCGVQYANKLADALDQRTEDNSVLQKADERNEAAILAVLTPGTDEKDVAELIAAVQAKADARRGLAEGREKAPYPPAPRTFCQ